MSQHFSQPPEWFYGLERQDQARALAVYRIQTSDPDTLSKTADAAKRRKLAERLGS